MLSNTEKNLNDYIDGKQLEYAPDGQLTHETTILVNNSTATINGNNYEFKNGALKINGENVYVNRANDNVQISIINDKQVMITGSRGDQMIKNAGFYTEYKMKEGLKKISQVQDSSELPANKPRI